MSEIQAEQNIEEVVEAKTATTAVAEQDDFLTGVQAADAESFNVCISCD